MEYLNGGELFYHLRKAGKFTKERVQFYAAEIVLAIEFLHSKGIIYRDLKPENVLLDTTGHVKITDFGLSKIGKKSKDYNTFSFCGTPEYLAPEIIEGQGHNKLVDWWSLGLMIYEMLSGINPFKLRNLNRYEKLQMIVEKDIEMLPTFAPASRNLLEGLLCRNPKKRFDVEVIKKHSFFEKIDWAALKKREV